MDVNWARQLFTVLVFVSFILVLYIVLNRRNKANYDEASRSIIDDDDTPHDNDNNSPAR
ncbi:cbb3-type cytochrome oxidase subunit 3 [Neisseria bacilliformis]|uniref:cbb3-type cytochrome oxidase subunit 3 n=1 Tax=Neisseria bacilliformis TaxID=267212 RepID=UPI00066786B8|nr:CcoQ/FixQ family Cbb3-type cytochrome c oxidase assembly chaperone [Neisseria bacilliformis]